MKKKDQPKKRERRKKSTMKKKDQLSPIYPILPSFPTGGKGSKIGQRINFEYIAIRARFSTKPKKIGRPPKWDMGLVATHMDEFVKMLPFPQPPFFERFINFYGIPRSSFYKMREQAVNDPENVTCRFFVDSLNKLHDTAKERLIIAGIEGIYHPGSISNALKSLGYAESEAQELGRGIAEGLGTGLFTTMNQWREQDRKILQREEQKKKQNDKKTKKQK